MDGSWLILFSMAFTLGIRHGFDLDHLATIDAITRTVADNHFLSRITGCLFSLGHGLVVTLFSIILGSGIMHAHTPQWLDKFGAWVSIVFLFLFGLLNLWNVLRNPSHISRPLGIKSFIAKKLLGQKCNPLTIIGIGALFALSFDTVTQVALFSLSATIVGGWVFSGILGLVFMIGMMVSDGLNGYLVSHLLQSANKTSLILSKMSGLAVALFSLTIGTINLTHVVASYA